MLKSKETLEEVKLNDLFEVVDDELNDLFNVEYVINEAKDTVFTIEDAIKSYNQFNEFLKNGEQDE